MSSGVLIDTGPLLASLIRREPHHDWAVAFLKSASGPLWTCEAVVSEACFLLRRSRQDCVPLLNWLASGQLRLAFRLADEIPAVTQLMQRYADVPMSLADACLVRMSELYADSVIWTLDADFRRYRRNRRQVIPLVLPRAPRR